MGLLNQWTAFWLVGLVLAVGTVWSQAAEQKPALAVDSSKIMDASWRISIDQPIEQVQELLDQSQTQLAMNMTSFYLSHLYDAKLYICFYRKLQRLDQPSQAAAIAEQTAWLKTRQAAMGRAKARYDNGNGSYGSGAPLAENMASMALTQKRLAAIEKTVTPGSEVVQWQDVPFVAEWTSNLLPAIEMLEKHLAGIQQQQPMNYTIANITMLYNAHLYIIFHHQLQSMEADDRIAAVTEQTAWLKKRQTAVDQATAAYGNGTGGPYAAGRAYVELTQARIQKLNNAQ